MVLSGAVYHIFYSLIKSHGVRIHKQHCQTQGRTAQPSHLPCPMAHSEEIFLWFICAITLAPNLFYTLVMNSITVLCILLSFFICTGANIKVDIDNIMIEKEADIPVSPAIEEFTGN